MDKPPLTSGCYCGALRYAVTARPTFKAQCHCRECQYISGGGPNYFMLLLEGGVVFTQGTPKKFTRSDLETPVTRDFCATCGTHILTHTPSGTTVLKVGTLDDPAAFGGPKMAIHTLDMQPFHEIPDGLPSVGRLPPR